MKIYKKGNFFPFFMLLFLLACNQNSNLKHDDIIVWNEQKLINVLKPGDVVLKMGYGKVSRLIAQKLNETEKFSHVVLVLRNTPDSTLIAHTLSGKIAVKDGVQTINLKQLLNDTQPGSLRVFRPKLSVNQINSIIKTARKQILLNTPFDLNFNNNDTTALYCNEFVNFCFAKTDILPPFSNSKVDEKQVLNFNSIFANPHFYEVFP